MIHIRIIESLFVLLLATSLASAQCSDAGVCSVGKKPTTHRHQIGASYAYGKGKPADGLAIHAAALEVSLNFSRESQFFLSLPWSSQSGPLGSTSGIGDLTLVWSQSVFNEDSHQLNIQIGGKLATAGVNKGNLPQAYQSGLGTNDLLFGLTYAIDNWSTTIGYQLSRGRSENKIDRLMRGDDALLRVGYGTVLGETKLSTDILAIKRLKESSVLDRAKPGSDAFVDLPGSDQFQINLLGRAVIPLQTDYSLNLLAALPLLNRKVNVDGLTRSITLSAGLVLAM